MDNGIPAHHARPLHVKCLLAPALPRPRQPRSGAHGLFRQTQHGENRDRHPLSERAPQRASHERLAMPVIYLVRRRIFCPPTCGTEHNRILC
jgi:hypothetical protein